MERLILKLVENQTVMSAITLLITSACGLGVAYLAHKRDQLVELSKGAKRSSIRSEYLQIYNSHDFTVTEKWEMTRPLVDEYFGNLQGNHYIHGLDEKLESLYEKEKQRGKRRNA
jgi:lipoprotein